MFVFALEPLHSVDFLHLLDYWAHGAFSGFLKGQVDPGQIGEIRHNSIKVINPFTDSKGQLPVSFGPPELQESTALGKQEAFQLPKSYIKMVDPLVFDIGFMATSCSVGLIM